MSKRVVDLTPSQLKPVHVGDFLCGHCGEVFGRSIPLNHRCADGYMELPMYTQSQVDAIEIAAVARGKTLAIYEMMHNPEIRKAFCQ